MLHLLNEPNRHENRHFKNHAKINVKIWKIDIFYGRTEYLDSILKLLGTLSTLYLTISEIGMPSLKSIGLNRTENISRKYLCNFNKNII